MVSPWKKVSTCRSKGAKREWFEKVYGYALACNSLQRQISPMEVVEDFESRPHKAVSFAVENAEGTCRNETIRSCLIAVEEVAREMDKIRRQRRRVG